jgi:hypothetical protein
MHQSDAAASNEGEAWRWNVGALLHAEIEEFLAGPQIARFACLDQEGWPYVVPCWQEWDGNAWWVIPRQRSAWAAYLQREPRCAITVDENGGRQRRCWRSARRSSSNDQTSAASGSRSRRGWPRDVTERGRDARRRLRHRSSALGAADE